MRLIMKQVHDKELNKDFLHFYVELENGYRIQIKNCFKDDFAKLRLLSLKVDD